METQLNALSLFQKQNFGNIGQEFRRNISNISGPVIFCLVSLLFSKCFVPDCQPNHTNHNNHTTFKLQYFDFLYNCKVFLDETCSTNRRRASCGKVLNLIVSCHKLLTCSVCRTKSESQALNCDSFPKEFSLFIKTRAVLKNIVNEVLV